MRVTFKNDGTRSSATIPTGSSVKWSIRRANADALITALGLKRDV